MQRPNILLILSDQHRSDAMGCAGHRLVQTPHLDRLAAEGCRFETAYCQSPLCGPSRSSILTGLYPHTCRAFTHGSFPLADLPTMASVFREAGYRTGGFGKMHVLGETRERDLGFEERGMRFYTYHFEDYIREVGRETVKKYARYIDNDLERYQDVYNPSHQPIDLPDEALFDHLVVERALDFLDRGDERPFFLWVGLEKPHTDWYAPKRFHDRYDPAAVELPSTLNETREDMPQEWFASTRQRTCFTEGEIRNAIAAYYANVSYMDGQVGRVLAKLEAGGRSGDTLVIYASDHGEMLFEHGMVQKHNFFEGSVRVPLILRKPGCFEGGTLRTDTARLLDLFPTMGEVTGVAVPGTLEGSSLVGETDTAGTAAMAEFYDWGYPERMIREGRWKYIESTGRPAQLYDLENDPQETRNRAGEPGTAAIVAALRTRLLADWEQPDMEGVRFAGAWSSLEEYRSRSGG